MTSRNWKVVACNMLIRPLPWAMKMRLPDLWKAASASTGAPPLPCWPSRSAHALAWSPHDSRCRRCMLPSPRMCHAPGDISKAK